MVTFLFITLQMGTFLFIILQIDTFLFITLQMGTFLFITYLISYFHIDVNYMLIRNERKFLTFIMKLGRKFVVNFCCGVSVFPEIVTFNCRWVLPPYGTSQLPVLPNRLKGCLIYSFIQSLQDIWIPYVWFCTCSIFGWWCNVTLQFQYVMESLWRL